MSTLFHRRRSVGGHIGVALGLLIPLLAAACASTPGSTTPGASTPVERQWGPLAVVESANGEEALISGTIHITDHCVFLDERGDLVLLVWPAERTIWDEEDNSVRFVTGSGEVLVFRSGDQAIFGGGGTSSDESGRPIEEIIHSVTWIAEPASECIVDTIWHIGDAVTDDGI